MNSDSKAWSLFYETDKEFLAWLSERSVCLAGENCLGYSEAQVNGNTFHVAPSYVRSIRYIAENSILEEARQKADTVEELYRLASNKDKIPLRFACFYDDLAQITIYKKPAISSRRVVGGKDFVLAVSMSQGAFETLTGKKNDLNNHGWDTVRVESDGEISRLIVSGSELLDKSGAVELQGHRSSGMSYTLGVRSLDGMSKKIGYGLVVLNNEPAICLPNPRKLRSDKLSSSKLEFTLPVGVDYKFYVKS